MPTGDLDGDWRVERTGGILLPMVGVWMCIRGERGETRGGPLLRLALRVERGGGRTVLAYEPPLSALVDGNSPAGRDLWCGRRSATLGGPPVGRFRMVRIGYHEQRKSRGVREKFVRTHHHGR